MYNIMAIVLENRREVATKVQEVLTDYGCLIKARIGLHEGTENSCNNEGLIILNLCDNTKVSDLKKELLEIEGVKAELLTI